MVNFLIKKMKFLLLFCMLFVLCLISHFIYFNFLHEKEFFMRFRKSTSLNYQRDNVPYVRVTFPENGNFHNTIIEESKKIDELKHFINSLDIIEVRKVPANKYGEDRENYGYILLYFGETQDHNPGDVIMFLSEYMVMSYNSRDWEGKKYYIKNSGYDDETKSSNIHQFLRDLIND